MAKKANRRSKRSGKTKAPEPQVDSPDLARRKFLARARNGVLGVALLGGSGLWAASAVRSTRREHDLSRIGNGLPTVVQIHDPQCSQCTALQRQARKALKCFETSDVQYLVASIRTEDGAAFAARHAVPHVTLMMFDGHGTHRDTWTGVRTSEELKDAFTGTGLVAMDTA